MKMYMDEDVKVLQTDAGAKDGQTKCPKCGATDIQTNIKTGKLRCNFCRHEFEPVYLADEGDISELRGKVVGSGAKKIEEAANDVVTLKCESCGAEVVVDTASSTQARCHWCRNTLSINRQIPNGAVPDVILPFKVSKEDARRKIHEFVNKRKFFAHPTFTREFTTENICGVYFPYMLVDVNAHMSLSGAGEEEVARYTVKHGKEEHTYYDADLYHVERDFDITIDDLSIEASADKLNYNSKEKTTNIINSIMPFDTEKCVKYDSNYLKGYTSEKRDTDISQLERVTHAQASDVARIAANKTLEKYDRGVAWQSERFDIKGESWKSSYLPVWLYSYMQRKGNKNLMHYVAVNARTLETMGSVPINTIKLLITSIFVEIFGGFLAWFVDFMDITDSDARWVLLLSGFAFYLLMYMRYRNSDARHDYENMTKHNVFNMSGKDVFIEHRRRLSNSTMHGANNTELKGMNVNVMLDSVVKKAAGAGVDVAEIIRNKSRMD